MARESAAAKARRYLGEGRVIVTDVGRDHAAAVVRGDGHRWHVTYNAGRWSCDCTARTDRCSHAAALRLVVAVEDTRGDRGRPPRGSDRR